MATRSSCLGRRLSDDQSKAEIDRAFTWHLDRSEVRSPEPADIVAPHVTGLRVLIISEERPAVIGPDFHLRRIGWIERSARIAECRVGDFHNREIAFRLGIGRSNIGVPS